MGGDDGDDKYRVHIAGEKPGDDDEDSPGPETGIISIDDRVSLEIVPAEEWAQMLEELREFVAENYFDKDYGGIDWENTCSRYRKLLARIRCRTEFLDLCTELLAELGISHTYISGPEEDEEPPAVAGEHGLLGVDVSWQVINDGPSGAYRVNSFVKGDIWDPVGGGPLARAGVGLTDGAYIIALNRVRVSKDVLLEKMLSGLGSNEVLLTFVPPENVQRYEQLQKALEQSGG